MLRNRWFPVSFDTGGTCCLQIFLQSHFVLLKNTWSSEWPFSFETITIAKSREHDKIIHRVVQGSEKLNADTLKSKSVKERMGKTNEKQKESVVSCVKYTE